MGISIVLTGASGFIGRQLVPLLAQSNVRLLVCGRDAEKLRALFPSLDVCQYDDLKEAAQGFDMLVHLATLNSNSEASIEEFRHVNIDLAEQTFEAASRAGVHKLIYISTVHALEMRRNDPYAITKREAEQRLRHQETAGSLLVAYLPTVYGKEFAGRLAPLNMMPRLLQPAVLQMASAIWPTLSVERLAEYLITDALSMEDDTVLLSDGQSANRVFRGARTALDCLFVLVVGLCLSWLLITVWFAVRMTSRGPGFFKQYRIGKGGTSFICWKFRTMVEGTRAVPTHEAPLQALTPIGKFLRASKIDELPQIINIVRGDMTLIGPRPSLPSQVRLIEERAKRSVLDLKPGITGLAQVEGIDMRDPVHLARRDEDYLQRQSLSLDLKIVLATLFGKRT
jgi:lipopolysaccharide/colanic/teichoic acid biosynthesis glycosyltransferase